MLEASDMAAAMLRGIGGETSPVDPYGNAAEFVRQHGLTFDGVPFDLDGRYKHWQTPYADPALKKVAMAGAQTGKSAWLAANLARDALGSAWGRMIGYYFPDIHLPRAFSRGRFKPFISSNPAFRRLISDAPKTLGKKSIDSILTITVGETTVYFLTIGGKTSTEGLPLKGVYFDEVRRMRMSDIERAQERYSAQDDPIDIKVSTARYPESDIHHYFLQGDQRYFHTACACPEGVVLSLTYPDCIADLRSATPQMRAHVEHAFATRGVKHLGMTESERQQYPDAAYLCPKCGDIIVDPRDGWWEPHADGFVHSYQMPQLLSPTYPAGHVLDKFEKSTDKQEFHNSTLGLPYIDRTRMPLQTEHVDACVDTDLRWGEHMSDDQRRRLLTNCVLGCDVQAGYGVCCIKTVDERGKYQTVHLEIVEPTEDHTWWHRLGKLMVRYDVRIAVIDEAPEYSESLAFAHAFRGRVHLANFAQTDGSRNPRVVAWEDDALADDKKQKGREVDVRFRVSMHRTKVIEWALGRWAHRGNCIPNLHTLTQHLPLDSKGRPTFSAHLRAGTRGVASVGMVLRDHLVSFIKRDLVEDEAEHGKQSGHQQHDAKIRQGKQRFVYEWIGRSPDFAFADLYASVAAERLGRPGGIRRLT